MWTPQHGSLGTQAGKSGEMKLHVDEPWAERWDEWVIYNGESVVSLPGTNTCLPTKGAKVSLSLVCVCACVPGVSKCRTK